jgi:citrate synthase
MAAVAFTPPDRTEEEFAILELPDGRTHKIRLLKPTLGGETFLDIRDLHPKMNTLTFDPGFTSTGSCMSAITFIDGPAGKCLYRGYPVAELCAKSNAMETAYLLLLGEIPTKDELTKFSREVKLKMMVHEKIKAMFGQFLNNAHPMAIMVAVMGALSAVYSDVDPFNAEQRWSSCIRLIAKVPVLAAMAYKTSRGQPIMQPRADLSMAENFVHMMFATPLEPYQVNPVVAKAIDAFMILHMDHEQNASTSTVRIAGSSQANPYASVAAGVACLWGPAHGGANEAVIKMLDQIGTKENVAQFVADVKAKKDGVRLMGFGHRVYKNYDPRARYMKVLVQEVLEELQIVDPKLEVAMELERVALSDEYFVKRKLYPNVDYYSGIMLKAIGIPTEMFTVMFAMSRTVGWVSHWNEMVSEAQLKIGRPRQLYSGMGPRSYPVRTEPQRESRVASQRSFERRKSFSEVAAMDEVAKKGTPTNKEGSVERTSSFRVSVPVVSTR